MVRMAIIGILLWSGCSKSESGKSEPGKSEPSKSEPSKSEPSKPAGAAGPHRACKNPMTVKLDGAEVTLPNALAVSAKTSDGAVEYKLYLFENPGVTCEELLAKRERELRDDEKVVVISTGETPLARSIAVPRQTIVNVGTELVGPPPKAPGDKLSICSDGNKTYKRKADKLPALEVLVAGTGTGKYCGARPD